LEEDKYDNGLMLRMTALDQEEFYVVDMDEAY